MRLLRNLYTAIFVGMGLFLLSAHTIAETHVDFEGTLVVDPCVVSPGSENQIVDFRFVPAKTFINHLRTAPEKFSIRLIDCDLTLGQIVKVTFSGNEDVAQPGLFAVEGDAKGIAIYLEDDQGNQIKPEQEMRPVALTDGETLLNYKAYLQGPNFSLVEEGDFYAAVTFYLEYE
ncbi:type 1 fimbria pilin [Serratia fonticola]|jgi:type 1 fimbria pilin|uniref:Type 1 fimbria pilin n=1 Tax=Serratia fonticola TaxID=47917 RepID=A0A559T1D2_SERFO|nr:fimbrial protein [Serratia fonticola]TQI79101.1 type 1 fimbria pilin [Serratia fonticola]TQI98876.1 type 1 fimbria pilin [Serratia fonticola]TVZ68401.1 type 1 fimbria pilin [Serratia fonticola]